MDPTHATSARSIRRPIMAIGGGAFSLDSGRGPLEAYHDLVGRGVLPDGIAVDDHAAAIYDGPVLEVVAAQPGPIAYRVERTPGGVVETPVPARVLPARVLAAGASG